MPGMVVFGRRWGIASDDLVFPGTFELFLRVIWYVLVFYQFSWSSGYLTELCFLKKCLFLGGLEPWSCSFTTRVILFVTGDWFYTATWWDCWLCWGSSSCHCVPSCMSALKVTKLILLESAATLIWDHKLRENTSVCVDNSSIDVEVMV